MDEDTESADIRTLLRRINRAWVHGPLDDLEACFHEDMVIVSPGFKDRTEGRAACVASYKEFIESATVHEYHESEPEVHIVGDTAVATYRYEIVYTMDTTDF